MRERGQHYASTSLCYIFLFLGWYFSWATKKHYATLLHSVWYWNKSINAVICYIKGGADSTWAQKLSKCDIQNIVTFLPFFLLTSAKYIAWFFREPGKDGIFVVNIHCLLLRWHLVLRSFGTIDWTINV